MNTTASSNPNAVTVTMGNNCTMVYMSHAAWKGRLVQVKSVDHFPCAIHAMEVMHHVDDEGRHFCPTGLLWCPVCSGTAEEPDPPECTLNGRPPTDAESI